MAGGYVEISMASEKADKLQESFFTWNHKSLIYLIPKNRPVSFQHGKVSETGLSNILKLISTLFDCPKT